MSRNPPPEAGTPAGKQDWHPRRGQLGEPRGEPDFDPAFYPVAQCVSAPDLPTTSSSEQIQGEFCAVYYRLNRLHARLQENRRTSGVGEQERELLRAIENHLTLRDELEDRYAPYGVIAEAVLEQGVTTRIKFTFGDRNILRLQRMNLISSTAFVFLETPGGTAPPSESSHGEAHPLQ
jgi:hypothetical protein